MDGRLDSLPVLEFQAVSGDDQGADDTLVLPCLYSTLRKPPPLPFPFPPLLSGTEAPFGTCLCGEPSALSLAALGVPFLSFTPGPLFLSIGQAMDA